MPKTPAQSKYVDSVLNAVPQRQKINSVIGQALSTVDRAWFIKGFYSLAGSEWHWIDVDAAATQYANGIYSNSPLTTKVDDNSRRPTSSSTMPSLMVEMLCALNARRGETVLEIGTGTGYNSALLSEIVGPNGSVYTIESSADVAAEAEVALSRAGYQNVDVFHGDDLEQVRGIRFDRIVATAGFSEIPNAWWDCVAPGGTVVAPIRNARMHPVVRVIKDVEAGLWRGHYVCHANFMTANEPDGVGLPEPSVRRSSADGVIRVPKPDIERKSFLDLKFFAGLEVEGLTDVYILVGDSDDRISGPGVPVGEDSAALVDRGSIAYCGANAEGAVERLSRTLERWIALGFPSIGRFEIRSDPNLPGRHAALEGSGDRLLWNVEFGEVMLRCASQD